MITQLESLKRHTKVVSDSGDIQSIIQYQPEDATTNPSLILNAAKMSEYSPLVDSAIAWGVAQSETQWLEHALDKLSVNFGIELLKFVPGRVSTEVDSCLSFDTQATIEKARKILALYQAEGICKERVLIKIASTWEGIKAAEVLEQEGINCNLTLLFTMAQAIACAEAKVYLVSPFVGRILDWHTHNNDTTYSAAEDPGVISVKNIYNYYKKFAYKTAVMGASFRNVGEICELAGCDRLTISPSLLAELAHNVGEVTATLSTSTASLSDVERITLDQASFRWMMNEDAMATEKLAEGIRKFNSDYRELSEFLVARKEPCSL